MLRWLATWFKKILPPIITTYSRWAGWDDMRSSIRQQLDSMGIDAWMMEWAQKISTQWWTEILHEYLVWWEWFDMNTWDEVYIVTLTNANKDILWIEYKSREELWTETFYNLRNAFEMAETDMTDAIWSMCMSWFSTTLTVSTSSWTITISDGGQSILVNATTHAMRYWINWLWTNDTSIEYTTIQTNGWLVDGTYEYQWTNQDWLDTIESIKNKSKIIYTVTVSTSSWITTITDWNETILYNISNQWLLYNEDYYAEEPNATALQLLNTEWWTTDGSYWYSAVMNKKADWDSIISLLKVSCISNATITHNIANREITIANGNRSMTIMDRNLGATEYLWETLNNETLAYGDFHQRWNDYWFSSDPTTSITTSWDSITWWGDWYTSSTFITRYNPYKNGKIWDRRGQYLAPAWYHIPSWGQDSECEKLINFLKAIRPNSYIESLVTELLIPLSGLRNYANAGNVEQQWAIGQQGSLWFGLWTTATPNWNASFVLRVLCSSDNWYIYPSNLVGRWLGYSVRCFKDTVTA